MSEEPPDTLTDTRELLLGYLDYYRDALLRKLDGMSEENLRTSILPSGWTPLGLLKHLAYVERRWFRWGFAAEQLDDIRGDRDPDTRAFHARPDESPEEIRALFLDECARTREIVAAADLQDVARTGGGFTPPEHHPALIWILFHVLQEYARHVGQLDIIRELTDGATGE
ncbi:DinB family protein [Actinomadura sp. KC216]|uniref:DinB family protein n=1 Tax=Actinomadura sp. KC216 TaxID=2530370 RepID=UPI00104911AB|nr:DinB family protein [Actinomadura sp. KC216]TDB86140.1 DinB family protein [Actinomadura sp. KC216]